MASAAAAAAAALPIYSRFVDKINVEFFSVHWAHYILAFKRLGLGSKSVSQSCRIFAAFNFEVKFVIGTE